MEIVFLYIVFCAIVGFIANDKAMGFWGGFLWSLLLSPIIGFIIVICSKSKARDIMERRAIQNMASRPSPPQQQVSVVDELSKLEALKEKKLITDEEYNKMRSNILKQGGLV